MTLKFQPFVYVTSLRLQKGSSRLRAQLYGMHMCHFANVMNSIPENFDIFIRSEVKCISFLHDTVQKQTV